MTAAPDPDGEGRLGRPPGFDPPNSPWRTGRSAVPAGADPVKYSVAYERLADALSQFLDDLAEAQPGQETVEALTAGLEAWSGELAPLAVPERERIFGRRIELDGRGQSMSPNLRGIRSDGDSVTATVRFGPYFLGGNGAAHGGTIPLLFDEILGRLAQSGGRPPSRTAYLNTDFRSITPIGPELAVRAWLVRHEGRKYFLRATLHHGETLCAEADALFVVLRPGQP